MTERLGVKGFVVALLVAFLFSGCAYHAVGARDLVAEMETVKTGRRAHISILWYQGSDAEFDYFAYVYAMVGTRKFKVPIGELVLPRFERTDDSKKWVLIREIGDAWFASRIVLEERGWERDMEGIRAEFSRGSAPLPPSTR